MGRVILFFAVFAGLFLSGSFVHAQASGSEKETAITFKISSAGARAPDGALVIVLHNQERPLFREAPKDSSVKPQLNSQAMPLAIKPGSFKSQTKVAAKIPAGKYQVLAYVTKASSSKLCTRASSEGFTPETSCLPSKEDVSCRAGSLDTEGAKKEVAIQCGNN